MTPQSPTPPDLLEQAHLALLRGHLEQARSLLDRLIAAEPGNAAAQDLRATVIAKQVAVSETARLQAGDFPGASPPMPAGSMWTRPVPNPTSVLLKSASARRWPKPLLLLACLLAGVVSFILPYHHRGHSYRHTPWWYDIVFGLIGGGIVFLLIVRRRR